MEHYEDAVTALNAAVDAMTSAQQRLVAARDSLDAMHVASQNVSAENAELRQQLDELSRSRSAPPPAPHRTA